MLLARIHLPLNQSQLSNTTIRMNLFAFFLLALLITAPCKSLADTMYYSLALEPDSDNLHQAARLRLHFDPIRAQYMRPHVTLKQPFRLKNQATESDLVKRLDEALVDTPMIELNNLGVNYFESKHYQYVVHWQLENSTEFKALTRLIATAVAPVNADLENYPIEREVSNTFPHLTLAQQVDKHTATVAFKSKLCVPLNKKITSNILVLAKSNNFQQWEVIKKFKFSENIY